MPKIQIEDHAIDIPWHNVFGNEMNQMHIETVCQ
jgi:hypothetical protein